ELRWLAAPVAVAAAGYVVWRRRKKRPAAAAPVIDHRARERLLATSLYELLEGAMTAQGVPRGASTPPLLHAEALKRLGHPLADEVLELTEVYLFARFGGTALGETERRNFEMRVKRVRSQRSTATVLG